VVKLRTACDAARRFCHGLLGRGGHRGGHHSRCGDGTGPNVCSAPSSEMRNTCPGSPGQMKPHHR